jgi:aspartate aminotransferase
MLIWAPRVSQVFPVFSRIAAAVSLPDVTKLFEPTPKGVINFGIGEPDFPPTEQAAKGLKQAVDRGRNKYVHTQGLPKLRQALSKRLIVHDKAMHASNILVTASATHGLSLAALTFYADGDEVLIPDPGFFYYRPHVKMMSAVPLPYGLTAERGFQPDLEEIKSLITPATKAIVVNSPSNPMGSSMDEKAVKGIADIANDKNMIVISDEVYSDLCYDGPHQTFLGKCEKLVYINSFSKIYALTGWRIGYMAAKPEMFGALAKMLFLNMGCVSEPMQYGALAALRTPKTEIKRRREVYRRRRDTMVEALKAVPSATLVKPTGAFYAFPSFATKEGLTSQELAAEMLKGGARVTSGIQFGANGEGHIRLSYSLSPQQIKKGVERIGKVAAQLA